MELPSRYSLIVDDVVSRSVKYIERSRVPAPTIIKGDTYSGTNLIVHEIYKKLQSTNLGSPNIKFLRLRLSDAFLTKEVTRELMLADKPSKKPTLFFMDGIDRILNLPSKSRKKGVKTGRSAKTSEIIEESHRLRKVLLENSNKVSLISSSNLNTKFMEDPDLPFYKFFNEILLGPLSAEESIKYFFSAGRKNNNIDPKLIIFNELGEISYEWLYKLTGGNWLLIQKFLYVLISCGKSINQPLVKSSVLDSFFLEMQQIFLMELGSYSREERRFIEEAILQGSNFGLKEIRFENGNASLIAKQLVEKGILNKSDKSSGQYSFSHIALRTLMRYFSGANLIDVFSDDRVLKQY